MNLTATHPFNLDYKAYIYKDVSIIAPSKYVYRTAKYYIYV